MSQRAESVLTYLISTFIVVMCVAGLVYPLTNPTAYAEMLKYPHFIPMVQNHIDPGACNLSPALVLESGSIPTTTCENEIKLV